MLLGLSMSEEVSADVNVVQGTEFEGKIDVGLTLFSTSSKYASVAFYYKKNYLDEWRSDAKIIASPARFAYGNELHGLPCSILGSENVLTWDHESNGVAAGSSCLLKIEVIPSSTVMCLAEGFTWIETLFKGGDRIVEGRVKGKAIGLDCYGNSVVNGGYSFSVVDVDSGGVMFELNAFPKPHHAAHAVGLPTGGLLAIGDNGLIVESDSSGNVIKSFDASAFSSGSATIAFNEKTKTVLVSGGNIPQVTEISWSQSDSGSILWSFGGTVAGNDMNSLNFPTGVSYGDGAETIAICDSGNSRVVIVDRSFVPQSVVAFNSISVGAVQTSMSAPAWCSVLGNKVYSCESFGKARKFSGTPASHPALARSGMVPASGEDSLPQYEGMCFIPIPRSIL